MDICDSPKPYVLDINSAFDRQSSKWRPANLPKPKKKPGHGIIYIGHGKPSKIISKDKIECTSVYSEQSDHCLKALGKCCNKQRGLSPSNTYKSCSNTGKSNTISPSSSVTDGCECRHTVAVHASSRYLDMSTTPKLIPTKQPSNSSLQLINQFKPITPAATLNVCDNYFSRESAKESFPKLASNQHGTDGIVIGCNKEPNKEHSQASRNTLVVSPLPLQPELVFSLTDIIDEHGTTTGTACIKPLHSSASSTMQVLEEKHGNKLATFYNQLYNHDQMTDIKVNVGNYSFSAHKVVLACFSPYFADIIINSTKKNLDQITLVHGVTPTGFKKILDYIYTNELTIEVESLAEILQAAYVLKICDLQSHCLSIFKTAKLPALLDILETAHKQGVRNICQNIILKKISFIPFREVAKLHEFNGLCWECLGLILTQDNLCILSEFEIAKSVLNWLEYAPDERMQRLDLVFCHVRLENLTSSEIVRLGQDAGFLMENATTRERMMRIQWYKRCLEIGFDIGLKEIPERPRKCVAKCKEPKHGYSEKKPSSTFDRPKQAIDKSQVSSERSRQLSDKNKSSSDKQRPERSSSANDKHKSAERSNSKNEKMRYVQEKVNIISDRNTGNVERQRESLENAPTSSDVSKYTSARNSNCPTDRISRVSDGERSKITSTKISLEKPERLLNSKPLQQRIKQERQITTPINTNPEKQKVIPSNSNNNQSENRAYKVSSYLQRTIENHSQEFHCLEMSTNNRFKSYDIHQLGDCTSICDRPSVVNLASENLKQVDEESDKSYSMNVVDKFPPNVSQPKAITVNNFLYLIGGTDEAMYSDSGSDYDQVQPVHRCSNLVFRYNIVTKEWDQWFPLWEARTLHNVIQVGYKIYTLGGLSSYGHCLSSVESLEYMNDKCGWTYETQMPSSRCSASVAALNDVIYVAGGVRNTRPYDLSHILSSVLCYNTRTRVWFQIESVRYPRFGATLATIDNCLYIIGGVYTSTANKLTTSNDIDMWNGRNWVQSARMKYGRCGAKVFVQDYSLVIVGGYEVYGEENSIIPQAEVLNTRNKIWEKGFDVKSIENLDHGSALLME